MPRRSTAPSLHVVLRLLISAGLALAVLGALAIPDVASAGPVRRPGVADHSALARAATVGRFADGGSVGHGEHALARATAALTGRTLSGSAPARPTATRRLDATVALRDLFLARPSLDGADTRAADHLLARPTDGPRDPYGDGYTTRPTSRCSAHFCIHWVTTTSDRATTSWVATTLRVMEQVWAHHIGRLGFRAPPTDGTRGGNAKFDVYLKNLGSQGLYGYCAPERTVSGEPHAASGFCVLDNDFSRAEYGRAPIEALKVTAAHEFFHAIQFGYDYTEDPWIMEGTAVWMEERFADAINDNRMYLPYGQVGIPSEPLDTFDASGFNQYGNWAFFEYLSEHYGTGIIRNLWQHLGNGVSAKLDSIQGVRAVLAHHGGLDKVYAAYAGGNTVPGRTYQEGAHFPAVQVAHHASPSRAHRRVSWSTRIDHLAAKDVVLRPARSLTGRNWRLKVRVLGPAAVTSPAAYLVVRKKHGQLVRHAVHLGRGGRGGATVSFDRHSVSSVTVTLANVSTRYVCDRGTGFSCAGTPRDDARRFTLQATAVTK